MGTRGPAEERWKGCIAPFARASLAAQTVKNLPAMQESRVLSLAREDPLEKGMTTSLPASLPGEFHGQAPLSMGSQRLGRE